MAPLLVPADLRLCDPVSGREATRVCVTFQPVPLATDYDLRVDGTTIITGFSAGGNVSGLFANTAYAIEVRARAAGHQDSAWSSPVVMTTRPPTPSPPMRLPVDLQGWGVTLDWDEPSGWNGAGDAAIDLLRDDGAGAAQIFRSVGLAGRYVDTRYPMTGMKAYCVRIVVDSATLGGSNESAQSVGTSIRGAINAFVPTVVTSPLKKGLHDANRVGTRLLGMRR